MGDLVNLRRERKRKARAEDARQAADRRVAFGVPKIEKQAAKARADLAERKLDAHKIEDRGPSPGDDD